MEIFEELYNSEAAGREAKNSGVLKLTPGFTVIVLVFNAVVELPRANVALLFILLDVQATTHKQREKCLQSL